MGKHYKKKGKGDTASKIALATALIGLLRELIGIILKLLK